ncbi:MAG: DUF928 domain-containing protein [Nitrospirae bacterium]|nr:DUF928 domain-containing protein [Nitrospirota bacterium]
MRRGLVLLVVCLVFVYGQTSHAADENKGLFVKYVPPKTGKPGARVGGGSRGAGAGGVRLVALVPDHTGFTSKPQPALCWHASKPLAAHVEITLNDDRSVAPLLEKQIAVPEKNGIQCVHLRDYGLMLKPGVEYQWFVAVVPDPVQRSKDIVSGGIISYAGPSKDLDNRVISSTGLETAAAYAEAGFWYDAVGILAEMHQARPDDNSLTEQMNSLLKQVGLSEVDGR